MSLSDDIIYGRNDNVSNLLNQGINVNFIDKYGYTPLIQAALVNNNVAAKMLLKAGAQIDAVDISGLSALHWAIDNNNIELVKLFLRYGANPNSYSSHGQPALFLPILRGKRDIQQLLIQHGADINFAKDFINAKLIGHRFELQGYTDVVSAEGVFLAIDLEGFFLEFTVNIIRDSLERFINSFVAHRLNLHLDELKMIVQAMKNASYLRDFKHFNLNVNENLETIKNLTEKDLLLLPVSFRGHAITFCKHASFWAKCDRGVHKMTDPIGVHHITKPDALDIKFYTNLLYEKQTDQTINHGIPNALGLKPFLKVPIRHQITGNCSWANVEASIPTMLFMLLYNKSRDRNQIKSIMREVMKFYVVWKEWDKDRALEECLDGFEQMNPNRRKAKATLLGSLFFQACDYRKKKDVQRAQKIMKILIKPEYHFVLRSYVNVFITGGQGGTPGKIFHRMLSTLGVKPDDFRGY